MWMVVNVAQIWYSHRLSLERYTLHQLLHLLVDGNLPPKDLGSSYSSH